MPSLASVSGFVSFSAKVAELSDSSISSIRSIGKEGNEVNHHSIAAWSSWDCAQRQSSPHSDNICKEPIFPFVGTDLNAQLSSLYHDHHHHHHQRQVAARNDLHMLQSNMFMFPSNNDVFVGMEQIEAMNRNARRPKKANKGARPCSRASRRRKKEKLGKRKR